MYHYKVRWGEDWLIVNEQEIRDVAEDVNKAIHIITDRWKYFPYSVWCIVVSSGLHERDTGYESFSGGEYPYNYSQPGEWVEDLVFDFREQQESKLDGAWFSKLNFYKIIVVIMGYKGPIVLEFQDGKMDVTISYDDHETQDKILQDLKNAFETVSE